MRFSALLLLSISFLHYDVYSEEILRFVPTLAIMGITYYSLKGMMSARGGGVCNLSGRGGEGEGA